MRVIIICAGQGKRWNNYLGVPKHLVLVDGKTLLDRTINQFCNNDIFIVANSDQYYQRKETKLFSPIHNPNNEGVDKIINSCCLWSYTERTLLLFGDVFFTDEAVQVIKEYSERNWTTFGRMGGSEITGCKWGELFAFSFYPEHFHDLIKAIEFALTAYRQGQIKSCMGWHVYRAWAGGDIVQHRQYGHFTEINDFTEDFDYPEDFDLWYQNKLRKINNFHNPEE